MYRVLRAPGLAALAVPVVASALIAAALGAVPEQRPAPLGAESVSASTSIGRAVKLQRTGTGIKGGFRSTSTPVKRPSSQLTPSKRPVPRPNPAPAAPVVNPAPVVTPVALAPVVTPVAPAPPVTPVAPAARPAPATPPPTAVAPSVTTPAPSPPTIAVPAPAPSSSTPSPTPSMTAPRAGAAAQRILGPTRSGLAWHSGAWVGGGTPSTARINAFGDWRGSSADAVTYYPERGSWAQLRNSDWHVGVWDGFAGRLIYGIPLLPSDGSTTLAQVATGEHDADFRAVAQTLNRHGRGNSVVRIGWEANGAGWWPWSVTSSNAATYRAAFARAAGALKSVAPGLVIDFDINCGTGLDGASDRLAALTQLYPGDSVVDVVGCDSYDWWQTKGPDAATFASAIAPRSSPGLADVATFARNHGKGMSVPEWGLAKGHVGMQEGQGDDAHFIQAMYGFFKANSDVLVYESYFNEPDPYIANGIWSTVQMPQASSAYQRLF